MVDDEIRELDLIRAEALAGQESRERSFGRFAIEADERANEYAEARGLSLGAADVVGRADAALGQQ
jgi:hypothetical protein